MVRFEHAILGWLNLARLKAGEAQSNKSSKLKGERSKEKNSPRRRKGRRERIKENIGHGPTRTIELKGER